MNYSSPGASLVTVLPSSSGVMRDKDEVVQDDLIFNAFSRFSAGASNFPHVQIFNPAGSGITGIIDHVDINSFSSHHIEFCFFNTELTTDAGVWTSRSGVGDDGLCHIRTQANTSLLGTFYKDVESRLANTWIPYNFLYGFQIAEGEGFLMRLANTNVSLVACFEGREV